jgi:hypothetical protein
MRTISVSRPAHASAASLIDALWSGGEWRAAWSGIAGFDIDYDDGEHQAARLRINWGKEQRTLSLVRFREAPGSIAFFCPSAPAPLSHQIGWWKAAPGDDGATILTAIRELDIATLPGEPEAARQERLDAYEVQLRERLGQILESFVARCGDGAEEAMP